MIIKAKENRVHVVFEYRYFITRKQNISGHAIADKVALHFSNFKITFCASL